jgi:hypothetical protein
MFYGWATLIRLVSSSLDRVSDLCTCNHCRRASARRWQPRSLMSSMPLPCILSRAIVSHRSSFLSQYHSAIYKVPGFASILWRRDSLEKSLSLSPALYAAVGRTAWSTVYSVPIALKWECRSNGRFQSGWAFGKLTGIRGSGVHICLHT